MTYAITEQCIGCSRCKSVCPTGAITRTGDQYQINSELCNNCVGYYSVPQCWSICPTNAGCIDTSELKFQSPLLTATSSSEYWESWFDTYNHLVSKLKAKKQETYWQQWFDNYSQHLSKVLRQPAAGVNA
ncbi:4Fe-4S binding protein [Leptodesmis sichuanensis]|jgi:MinD superfamily P-loop ATPase|uniref:4Fe-4S binding protein n=1 Tax=Leptodesmis sichuanensis TaxID=2906798 RepID=UPI001F1C452F|nr:4Fe-4S binding protein [Leptodesmis sichuanensis]UIE38040.1 4Fe-4S binding protein [Leptodesmis sichuanensis A121]